MGCMTCILLGKAVWLLLSRTGVQIDALFGDSAVVETIDGGR